MRGRPVRVDTASPEQGRNDEGSGGGGERGGERKHYPDRKKNFGSKFEGKDKGKRRY